MSLLVFALVVLVVIPRGIEPSSITLVDKLYKDCLDGYNRKTLPVINHNRTVEIDVNIGLVSINSFDEISGELHLTTVFFMVWTEERITWSPEDYGGKTILTFPPEDIWHPKIFVVQSFDRIQHVGEIPFDIRLANTGKATWSTGMVLRVSCFVDVTYFPFDTQQCELQFSGWMYASDEVQLMFNIDSLYMKFFTNNSQWIVSDSKLRQYTINTDFTDYEMPPSLLVHIWLKRRHEFYLVYIIIPVIFLAIINNLVFLLPASSGERTSVAVTVFLSLVVYMGVINSSVPESSAPVAYIYIYILFLLVYSSCILFLCIASLSIHDKTGTVPKTIQTVVNFMRGIRCRRNRQGPMEMQANNNEYSNPAHADDNENQPVATIAYKMDTQAAEDEHVQAKPISEREISKVTWNVVGNTFDIYCSLCMYLALAVFSFDTFNNLYRNTNF